MWNNDGDLGPFRVHNSDNPGKGCFVSMGRGIWAPSWPELHLTQTRWQEGYWCHFPWAFNLPGHLQSRWELNHRPRAQLLWKMAFQPLNHHSKGRFSRDIYSVILCFLTAKVMRLKFLCLCSPVPSPACCSSGTIKPACGAGAPLGQPWNGCLSVVLEFSGQPNCFWFSFNCIHFYLFGDAKLVAFETQRGQEHTNQWFSPAF